MKYNLFPYSFVMSPKMSNKNDVIYGQVWWPILGICALHLTHPKCTHTHTHTHTHSSEHTHTAWTHTQQWTHTHSVNTHTHSSEHTHTPWTHTRGSEHTHTAVNTHTQQWTHTHTVNTHPEQWAVVYAAAPGSSWGSVPCSRASQSWYWGWRERCTFTRLRVRLSNHWATSHDFPLNVSLN